MESPTVIVPPNHTLTLARQLAIGARRTPRGPFPLAPGGEPLPLLSIVRFDLLLSGGGRILEDGGEAQAVGSARARFSVQKSRPVISQSFM